MNLIFRWTTLRLPSWSWWCRSLFTGYKYHFRSLIEIAVSNNIWRYFITLLTIYLIFESGSIFWYFDFNLIYLYILYLNIRTYLHKCYDLSTSLNVCVNLSDSVIFIFTKYTFISNLISDIMKNFQCTTSRFYILCARARVCVCVYV